MPQAPLTDKQIRVIDTPGKHWAAPGLYVICTETGAKSWYARIQQLSGKRTWRALGSCDELPIKQAQKQAIMLSGTKVDKSNRGRTFKTAFLEYITTHQSDWKNESSLRQWNQSFTDYIDSKIGSMAIADIRPHNIADLLRPIWTTKAETARRVRGRIEQVIDYEQARQGVLDANPAQMRFMRNLLSKQKSEVTHLAAPTLAELQALYQSLNTKSASHRALRWTIEHACRTTETREATWDEVQGDVWVIPAARMKGGKAHVSPIVGEMHSKGKATLLFPNADDKPLSINGMRAILQKRGITWTVHGVRSCFRTWCQENGIPDRVAEAQLAHVDKDQVQRAYARSDLLDERRAVLTKWLEVLNAK